MQWFCKQGRGSQKGINMPFCYQTLCYVQLCSVSQSWLCQKPVRQWRAKGFGGRKQRRVGAVKIGWEIQKTADATEASFRPGLLIKESLPEGTRQFAKFALGNTEEIKEACLIQLNQTSKCSKEAEMRMGMSRHWEVEQGSRALLSLTACTSSRVRYGSLWVWEGDVWGLF